MNLCPIPVVILYNRNTCMFKSMTFDNICIIFEWINVFNRSLGISELGQKQKPRRPRTSSLTCVCVLFILITIDIGWMSKVIIEDIFTKHIINCQLKQHQDRFPRPFFQIHVICLFCETVPRSVLYLSVYQT